MRSYGIRIIALLLSDLVVPAEHGYYNQHHLTFAFIDLANNRQLFGHILDLVVKIRVVLFLPIGSEFRGMGLELFAIPFTLSIDQAISANIERVFPKPMS
jgi:hypothetical protein